MEKNDNPDEAFARAVPAWVADGRGLFDRRFPEGSLATAKPPVWSGRAKRLDDDDDAPPPTDAPTCSASATLTLTCADLVACCFGPDDYNFHDAYWQGVDPAPFNTDWTLNWVGTHWYLDVPDLLFTKIGTSCGDATYDTIPAELIALVRCSNGIYHLEVQLNTFGVVGQLYDDNIALNTATPNPSSACYPKVGYSGGTFTLSIP